MTDEKQINRRNFIQNVSTGAAGIAIASVLSTLNATVANAQKPDYYSKMDMSKLGNKLREPVSSNSSRGNQYTKRLPRP